MDGGGRASLDVAAKIQVVLGDRHEPIPNSRRRRQSSAGFIQPQTCYRCQTGAARILVQAGADRRLPLYNQDDDASQADVVKRLKAEITGSHGVLFVTAEYNRSIPGVLKNAIDHASRPYGQSAWAGKPAGILGVSVGAIGTAIAQQHLRNVLAYLDMPTLAHPKHSSTQRMGCSTRPGTSDQAAGDSSRAGWTSMSLGWNGTTWADAVANSAGPSMRASGWRWS
jgi:chromate reductase, NAD(P)H dehydrogenase (quinone)